MKTLRRLSSSHGLLVLMLLAGGNLAGVIWDCTHATECTSANAPQIVGCQAIRDAVQADEPQATSAGNAPVWGGSLHHRTRTHRGVEQNLLLPDDAF